MMSSVGFLLDRLLERVLQPLVSSDRSYTHCHQPAFKIQRHTKGHVMCLWIFIMHLIQNKCGCQNPVAWNRAKSVRFEFTHKHTTHTRTHIHTLMPKVQAGGNIFLTWNRQPATCHAAPHTPNRHTNRRTYPHTPRWPRTGVSRLHNARRTQVHALLLPLANYHLQTPYIVSLLPVSDL